MNKGIAHVSFLGGGMFVPASSPYDRQVLAEHVLNRTRQKGQVQVLINNQRWMVHRSLGPRSLCCTRCQSGIDAVCYLLPQNETPYCVCCAFGPPETTTQQMTLQPQAKKEYRAG
jgi:hypothetical protein